MDEGGRKEEARRPTSKTNETKGGSFERRTNGSNNDAQQHIKNNAYDHDKYYTSMETKRA